jgi:hypothetical protein
MSFEPSPGTFSSLRARREAHQIASDILYEDPIDVRIVACRACGAWIDVHGSTITDPLHCSACGTKTPLPAYLRAKFMPRRVPPPKPLHYFAANEPAHMVATLANATEESLQIPPWLLWLNAILITLGIGVALAMLFW